MFRPWEYVETYDLTPFAFARAPDRFHIDPRHLQILFAIASEIHPRAVMQLGCADAFSASCFIAMLNAGFVEEAHFVDPQPTESLRRVLGLARIPKRVHFYGTDSRNAPLIDADLWLMTEADSVLLDIERAFSRRPLVLAVRAEGETPEPDIAEAGMRLRTNPEFTAFEDPRAREDVSGFTICLRTGHIEPDVIELARDLIATDRAWWREA